MGPEVRIGFGVLGAGEVRGVAAGQALDGGVEVKEGGCVKVW